MMKHMVKKLMVMAILFSPVALGQVPETGYVTCWYIKAFPFLLGMFDSLPDFGDEALDMYFMKARGKVKHGYKKVLDGNVIASYDLLVQAVKFLERANDEAKDLGIDGAVEFANKLADMESDFAVVSVYVFIMDIQGDEALEDDDFIFGKPIEKIDKANTLQSDGKWKKATRLALFTLRLLLNEIGIKNLEKCPDDVDLDKDVPPLDSYLNV